jgi:hypothetical protein
MPIVTFIHKHPAAAALLVTAAALLCVAADAIAQIPPHAPGTVCVANNNSLWCWTSTGPVGSPCSCRTPLGDVPGRRQ